MMTSQEGEQDGLVLPPPTPVQTVLVVSYSVAFYFFVAAAVNDAVVVAVDIVSVGWMLVDEKSALEHSRHPPPPRCKTQKMAVAAVVVPIVVHEFAAMWLVTNPDPYPFSLILLEFGNSSVSLMTIVQ